VEDVSAAFDAMTYGECMRLAAALGIARQHNVPPEALGALAAYCHDAIEWYAESDRRHFETCSDPECETAVCRAGRGLPPLTLGEILEGRRRRLEERRKEEPAAAGHFRRGGPRRRR
jgi:hypothetical protein